MKLNINPNIKVVSKRNKDFTKVDYFFRPLKGNDIYAFTSPYTTHTYDLCVGGCPIGKILSYRGMDRGLLKLKKRVMRITPYLKEEYSL